VKAWLPLLVAAAALSGCAAGQPASPNPNLAAPKLVVAARADGNFTVFMHAAFGDRAYDWLTLSLDNASVANRTSAYSLEQAVNGTGFFLDVGASSQGQLYQYRARIDVIPGASGDRLKASVLDDEGRWSEPRTFNMPFEQILDHPRSP